MYGQIWGCVYGHTCYTWDQQCLTEVGLPIWSCMLYLHPQCLTDVGLTIWSHFCTSNACHARQHQTSNAPQQGNDAQSTLKHAMSRQHETWQSGLLASLSALLLMQVLSRRTAVWPVTARQRAREGRAACSCPLCTWLPYQ